ncbi:MAG: holo-ACP synthase [Gammaproteobacteria bacterium]|nr:holo-ACP synthase [Gammaproteobacteria bacterium]
MTIHGIGTDIVRVSRMEDSIRRHGERIAARILTAAELEEYRLSRLQARFLAKRFAAKEAMVKALGTGFSRGIGLRDVAVSHEPGGRPFLICTGTAQRACEAIGITATHLSLTDEAEYAVAFVVMERESTPSTG